ncbi:NAD(P)/FAD-dependent oxidoreductase [Enterococcus sp. BWB1-3]|uniref:dihydrolipoyl dehydrogenase family protein n=1 Tax=Enterococcus sp. BWB1-3 TaxID=2787713 RepID=UPI001922B184|nr:NAD(P)/FAD-dependent oxidoreductase [Enterococcus sp. BWB1-3]MBL1229790.1 NAD(P)/FAD-dependent oxidoreductase [Enterococcus sp. BWB1-3]
MKRDFDVIIVGSGPGGMAAAYDLKAAGKSAAVVEADKWGGTCPNRGCDPKKILYHAIEVQENVKQLAGHGTQKPSPIIWEELMAFKEEFTSAVPREQKEGLTNAGIEVIEGKAVFEDQHTIVVENRRFTADYFILAAGQHAAILDIPGKVYLETSTDFLEMFHLPKTILFIGGGYISFELANIAHKSGSDVHIIHHNDRPLKGFDKQQVFELTQRMVQDGIHFHFSESVTEIKKEEGLLRVKLEYGKELIVEKAICATGRIPNVEKMNLEEIGVAYSKRGIEVDGFLRTSVSNIYALGDCLAKKQPKLTPVSSFEGSYLASLISGNEEQKINYPQIPTILFTSPKLAQVGKTEVEEQEKEEFKAQNLDLSGWFTYKQRNELLAEARIVVNKKTGLLVGASLLSNEADQLVSLMTLLINQKISAADISKQMMLYPTVASDINYLY